MSEKILSKEERVERDATLTIKNLKISEIKDNPYQPRTKYQKAGIKLLAKSISNRGLYHPVSVVSVNDHYVLVGGHRRIRAFKALHRKTIPAIIRGQSSPEDLALDLAIENAMRKDFTPSEKGQAIFQAFCVIPNVKNDLIRTFTLINQIKLYERRGEIGAAFSGKLGFTYGDLIKAKKILNLLAISRNTAIKYIRILGLPKTIRDKIIDSVGAQETHGFIPVQMAYEISRIKDKKIQRQLFKRAIKQKLRGLELKFVVDALLKEDKDLANRYLGKGSTRADKNIDDQLADVSKKCLIFSSTLNNIRRQVRISKSFLDRVVWRASLNKLRKAALDLVSNINDQLEDLDTWEKRIDFVNQDLELLITSDASNHVGVRFSLPKKKTEILRLEPGDVMITHVKWVRKKQPLEKIEDFALTKNIGLIKAQGTG